MRNLELVDCNRVNGDSSLYDCQALTVDYDTKVVYCGTGNGIYVVDSNSQQVTCGVSLASDGYLPTDGSGKLVGVHHLADQMSVCIATENGDLLLWSIGSEQVECVGSVESGIQSMAWSPDQEILVLITGQNTLVLMTRDFDPITEVALHPSEFGEAQFVNVGWGKKETQFHGSEGKEGAARKKRAAKPVSAWDDLKPRISWRGDGQYFVVSSVHPDSGTRILRTWTRECALHSTSEIVDGIEQSLAWKPTGMLIATSQRLADKMDIAFFERNGLRHGEFTLPFPPDQVKVRELYWNTESTVLCVWLEEIQVVRSPEPFYPKSWVQLWTTGNYHWYLKQSLEFNATKEDRVTAITWDPEQEYTLHMVCGNGRYLHYRWAWSTSVAQSSDLSNDTPVAVIDGAKVLVTPFKSMIVPPPMCAYSLLLEAPANNVIFSHGSRNELLALLSNERIAMFSFDNDKDFIENTKNIQLEASGGTNFAVKCRLPNFEGYFKLDGTNDEIFPLRYHHIMWCNNTVIICTLNESGDETLLYVFEVIRDRQVLRLAKKVETFQRVFTLACSVNTGNVAVQMTDGAVFKLDLEQYELTPWFNSCGEHVVFPQPCSKMALCTLGQQEVVIGLTERFRLYVDNLQLATNCTSFAIHEEFLLLTSHAHTIRCICRNTKFNALSSLAEGKAHPFDETVRRVERGSRIVCVVCDDTRVVLQMPRGNLETIHPRALVLSAVRQRLDRLQFKEAFVLMRKHRINMNLIYDHNPAAFINNVQQFISQIANVTHINLFLTDLVEEDVTQTMYTAAHNRDVAPTFTDEKKCKVDIICDSVMQALRQIDKDRYLLSILTAHVRKSTPELDVALNIVNDLKGASNKGPTVAEEALKYLLFLVDVNELYDVALGTYDFQLVLMVAEKSQKDPKEYLPFLNNLRKLDEDYRKYSIDKHLKRYHSALEHISHCGKEHFEECMNLVKDQRLYAHALKIYPVNSDEYSQIANAYGDYLMEKKYHEEAGLLYTKAKNYEKALGAFTRSVNWRQCLCMANLLSYSTDKMMELSRSLALVLKEKRQFSDAACLLEQYANDSEEAIVILIEGRQWDEALRLMHKHKRLDFVETNLKPYLEECYENQTASLDEMRKLFDRHRLRLDIVREEKEKRRLEIIEHGEGNKGDSDLFSDTSSATGDSVISDSSRKSKSSQKSGSIFTRVSGKSGKAKRKKKKVPTATLR